MWLIGELTMYLDTVVVAGIVTVLLLIGFFVGFGIFIVKNQKTHDIRNVDREKRERNLV